MKNNINDRKYSEFSIWSLFEITRGNAKSIRDKSSWEIVLVSAIDNNNWFYQMVQHENEKVYSNVLTVNNNWNGVCLSYYHEYKFMASSDVSILLPKNNSLKKREVGLFISCLIKKQKSKFNYWYKMNNIRMEKQKILIPVDDLWNPDYKFMEDFIKEREEIKREKYRKYVENQIKMPGENWDFRERNLLNKKWKEFFIQDIFSISSWKRLESKNMIPWKIPFIWAVDSGNWITNYISNTNNSLDKNVLWVNYDGNWMVISFYHQYNCLFSDSVKRFHFSNYEDSKLWYLFSKVLLLKQKSKYNYWYKFNEMRMKKQKIMLPITEQWNPDYNFMENYAKSLMIKKYKKYLEYVK